MAPSALNERAKQLRDLHLPGRPLVLANVYDAATASIVANLANARAVATASYAVAAVEGVKDEELSKEQNLAAIRRIAPVVANKNLPLTVDIQDGYDDVKQTIRDAIALGAVGCNLEDLCTKTLKVRPLEEAAERVRLAMEAARESGVPDFVINARTDILGEDTAAEGGASTSILDEVIRRGKAYLAAGACTVFIWGGGKGRGVSRQEVEKFSWALDGRISVKKNMGSDSLSVADLATIGVARISVGPELFRVAMRAYQGAAEGLLE
ncbi:carboxyphosphonoenolpyruvate phosphonomutase-like protein [Talaromyces proteolyticus]|uniref:Carboxyphosphonoenolpyruvate phosphonomutase-like protein n=1 Tax=Talaromyces proteolyticus TaxID=1131652 RepID=A0AAD4KQ11_9EURO|nr:carboxyphosphonoenolpyruvate phosphonomutase-like protein [Talaromyces proteolyticus]KAH8693599.1 carboxyphosphonoenolpyruvate phosphonomutase-like protein [Talaromyces proteolyticus]